MIVVVEEYEQNETLKFHGDRYSKMGGGGEGDKKCADNRLLENGVGCPGRTGAITE